MKDPHRTGSRSNISTLGYTLHWASRKRGPPVPWTSGLRVFAQWKHWKRCYSGEQVGHPPVITSNGQASCLIHLSISIWCADTNHNSVQTNQDILFWPAKLLDRLISDMDGQFQKRMFVDRKIPCGHFVQCARLTSRLLIATCQIGVVYFRTSRPQTRPQHPRCHVIFVSCTWSY